MTAIALTEMRATTLHRLDRTGWWALAAAVAALQLSIAAAQIALTVAALAWVARAYLAGAPEMPRFVWPLAVYAALTLLSASLSRDPAVSVPDTKQLVLFLLVPIVYEFGRGTRARTLATIALSVGAASALVGIVQYGVLNYDNLGRRPQGTLSHWMTYSGTLMLVICATVARLLFEARDRMWAVLVMPALVAGLGLTFTRSAWVGASAGVGTLFLLKDRRLVGLLPIALAVLVAAAPAAVTTRVYSMFDRNDPTNRDRMAMLEAGQAIVRDHPFAGVGPDMITHVYPRYRVPWAVQPNNPHLHNVPMQIAAERGLPALGAWLWFLASATRGMWHRLRHTRRPALAAGGLAAVAAMLAAGLFEYNFGDSEFLMLFLVLVTLPYAADRGGGLP
ncbi:MAG TPA: O-antigen ligase family protein [Vicinamibacterales bacterium]|nr:O-antigen ligase family protein [Vicinamibacterales bacterium]